MPRDEDIIGDFPAYAFGALDNDAQRAVEDLVERDADAAAKLEEMLETVAEFSAQIGEAEPPLTVRQHLLAAVKSAVGVSEQASVNTVLVSDAEIAADFPGYAFGALDDDARRAVEELVERDADAAAELGEMLETVAEFSAQIGEAEPPLTVRRNLLAAVKSAVGVSERASVSTVLASDEEIIADFPGYALDALDDVGRRAVEELVARDADAAVELEEMLETVADFSSQVGQVEPPLTVRQNLLASIRSEVGVSDDALAFSTLVAHLEQRIAADEIDETAVKPRLWDRIGGVLTAGRLAFATSVAALAIVGIMAVQLGTDNVELNRRLADSESMVSAAYAHAESVVEDMSSTEQLLSHAHDRISEQELQIVRMTELNDAMRTSMNDQISLTYATLRDEYHSADWQSDALLSTDGFAYLLEHKERQLGALVIGGVEQAPHGQEYRLYLVGEEDPHYVTSFDVNEAGNSTILFELSHPLNNYLGAHITLEPSSDPPDPSLASLENRFTPQ